MAYQELREFLDKLEQMGELHRIRVEVDPVLEMAEITNRVSKSPAGGRALLFERVKGSRFLAATNVYGSYRRVCAALGVAELAELTRRVEALLCQARAGTEADTVAALADCPGFAGFLPESVALAPCQEVVEPVPDLDAYPILKNWPGDGLPGQDGRFITLPLVFTRDPLTGFANCGIYLVQVLSGNTVGIRWRAGSGGAAHWLKYRARSERMPVAIALGGDPVLTFAAFTPLPAAIDEMQFAGFLRGESVQMVKCRTSDIMVPAGAELVIEGEIDPGAMSPGGAFGNHTGFYVPTLDLPVMRITCISRRREPIFPATVIGRPPMEDCYMAKAVERLMLPFVRLALPEVVAINLPLEGIFHGAALIAIDKRGPGQPREVMQMLWSSGWLAGARLLVIVDSDLDVQDLPRTFWKVLNHVDWHRDLIQADPVVEGDPARNNTLPFGGRLGIDATRKMPGEGLAGPWPQELAMDEAVMELVGKRWREYGFPETATNEAPDLGRDV
jgi:4-hydroxy-3-polyprenylbenzoate decarboxylase